MALHISMSVILWVTGSAAWAVNISEGSGPQATPDLLHTVMVNHSWDGSMDRMTSRPTPPKEHFGMSTVLCDVSDANVHGTVNSGTTHFDLGDLTHPSGQHASGLCQPARREQYHLRLLDYMIRSKLEVTSLGIHPLRSTALGTHHVRTTPTDVGDGPSEELPAAAHDQGQCQHDRREQFARNFPHYMIQCQIEVTPMAERVWTTQHRGMKQQVQVSALDETVSFMQEEVVLRQGWFRAAVNGFRWLQERGRHKQAALTLREKLRQVRDPSITRAARAHLPDILEVDHGAEGGVASEYQTDEETWASFVLGQLTRIATSARPQEDSDTQERSAGSAGGSGLSSSPVPSCGLITHAAHLWPDGTWSTREDLLAAGRTDLLPPTDRDEEDHSTDGTTASGRPAGNKSSVDMPPSNTTQTRDDTEGLASGGHALSSQQALQDSRPRRGARRSLEDSWAQLMEQLWTWFDEELAVDLALAMLRQRVMDRQEGEYAAWAEGPLRTIGAGIADCNWQSAETTPPRFFLWARRVEAHLRRIYMDSMEDTASQADEVSMMERPSRSRRRRHRPRSRSAPRGRGSGNSGARVTEEVRHLGGGRASGSGSNAGHLGDQYLPIPKRRPDADWATACPHRAHRTTGHDGTCRDTAAEPASGSGGPGRASGSGGPRRDEVRIVDPTAGLPDLEEPLTMDQAVGIWRYLLFDRNSFAPGQGKIRETWLPQDTLTNVSVHCEAMSEYNMQMFTIGLLTMIRYLMAELSQTLSMAQAIRNSRLGLTDPVDLDEGDEEEDGAALMQSFFHTEGQDTPARRWARALLRLHKELEGQPKAMRIQSVAALRAAMPANMVELESVAYQAQLQALLVAIQDDSQEAQGHLDVPGTWLEDWITEIGVFIPGYRRGHTAQLVDSGPEVDIDTLLQDEAEERAHREACEAQAAEEEEKDRLAREAQENLYQQELDHLEQEAKDYKDWERAVEARALKRPGDGLADREGKSRCVLTVEMATGSGDEPRLVRTMGVDLPLNGTPVVIRLRAELEPNPSEVSTVPVSPLVDVGGTSGLRAAGGTSGPRASGPGAASEIPAETVLATTRDECSDMPSQSSQQAVADRSSGLLHLLDFKDYEVLYDRWYRGELNYREVILYYGAEVLDLMLAQEAVSREADGSQIVGCVASSRPSRDEEVQGMHRREDGVWVRFGFAQFEVVYGQWKLRERKDDEVTATYGSEWVRLFRVWQTWGLQAIWHLLPRVLDVAPDTATARSGVDFHLLRPEPLPEVIRLPFFVIKDCFEEWMNGDLTDARVGWSTSGPFGWFGSVDSGKRERTR